jgi:hypothetical protein
MLSLKRCHLYDGQNLKRIVSPINKLLLVQISFHKNPNDVFLFGVFSIKTHNLLALPSSVQTFNSSHPYNLMKWLNGW